jgi:hypothetical protein
MSAEIEKISNKIKEIESKVNLSDKKVRSKLDYLLKEIQKLRPPR